MSYCKYMYAEELGNKETEDHAWLKIPFFFKNKNVEAQYYNSHLLTARCVRM